MTRNFVARISYGAMIDNFIHCVKWQKLCKYLLKQNVQNELAQNNNNIRQNIKYVPHNLTTDM